MKDAFIALAEQHIATAEYHRMGRKTTVCLVTLLDGFEVAGSTACVDPERYDQELGERLAFRRARLRVAQFLERNAVIENEESPIITGIERENI